MSQLDWLKDDDPPDAWTPDRERRVWLLSSMGGNLERAQLMERRYVRAGFWRFLAQHGHLDDDITAAPVRSADDVRAIARRVWDEQGLGR